MKAHDFIRSQKNDVLQVGVCVGVCTCVHTRNGSPRAIGAAVQRKLGKESKRVLRQREEGRKEEMEASLQLSVIDSLKIWLL